MTSISIYCVGLWLMVKPNFAIKMNRSHKTELDDRRMTRRRTNHTLRSHDT